MSLRCDDRCQRQVKSTDRELKREVRAEEKVFDDMVKSLGVNEIIKEVDTHKFKKA